jgi:hypothetical protein
MPERPRSKYNAAGGKRRSLAFLGALGGCGGVDRLFWPRSLDQSARGVSVATSGMRPLNEREVRLM